MIKSRELPTASGKAEYSNRPGVPKADKAIGVGGNDRIRDCPEDRLDKTVRYTRRSLQLGARHRVVLCKIKDLQMSALGRSRTTDGAATARLREL